LEAILSSCFLFTYLLCDDHDALINELEKLHQERDEYLSNPTHLPRPIIHHTIAICHATIPALPPLQTLHLAHTLHMERAHL
jgi:hypothetical protein